MNKFVLMFMFVASFAFTQETDPWVLVEELTNELEESNELIIELRNEVSSLEKEKNELETSNSNLETENEELQEENSILQEENNTLLAQLEETTNELIACNNVLIDARNDLIECQEELTYFREQHEESVIGNVSSPLGIGIGMAYPIGAEAILTFELPFLNIIELYGRAGFNERTIISAGAGIIVNF